MSESRIERFQAERERLQERVMHHAGLPAKRFHGIDHQVYQAGALPAPQKELLGLVASLVLRCDDCVLHHLIQCHAHGVIKDQLEEAVAIGMVVGGSITIPHVRRLWAAWDELRGEASAAAGPGQS